MKERPILFSGEMVRAILDGSKTQTRRVVKGDALGILNLEIRPPSDPIFVEKCLYGKPGDRLWVREAWAQHTETFGDFLPSTVYRADPVTPHFTKWKPSIHMPRWASRITLEITGVRVERLQDISEKDALSEGCEPDDGNPESPSPISEFRDLWQSINGAESWAANQWVWVIEFKKC